MKDDLGDRMKQYESLYEQKLMPRLPIIARIDGKSFHTFTKGLKRPYDERLSKLMIATTKVLVKGVHAKLGYTQSDEISLYWGYGVGSQPIFGGKLAKLQSVLSSIATAFFNRDLQSFFPKKDDLDDKHPVMDKEYPTFDCRVFQLPSIEEASNYFLWREKDAVKNSITMAASEYYSHAELQGKNSKDKHEMLYKKGVNWDKYPKFFKQGTYVRRELISKKISMAEWDNLPPKHEAKRGTVPCLSYTRSEVNEFPFSFIIGTTPEERLKLLEIA